MDNQQKRPIIVNLSWLAGMWEADGSFSLSKNERRKYIQYEPQLQFVNTDFLIITEVIEILRSLQVGYYFLTRIQPKNGYGKKLKYEIRVQGMKRCYKLLHYLIDYIRGSKKQKAQFIFDFISLRLLKPKNQRYGDEEHALYQKYEKYNNELLEFSTTNMLNTWENRTGEDRV